MTVDLDKLFRSARAQSVEKIGTDRNAPPGLPFKNPENPPIVPPILVNTDNVDKPLPYNPNGAGCGALLSSIFGNSTAKKG